MRRLSITARLRLLPTEQGGRMRPIRSDYRPNWNLGNTWRGEASLDGGRVLLEGIESLAPGEEGVATIDPLSDEMWGLVEPGRTLPMQEASKVVGYATVTSVTRPPYLTREVAAFVLDAKRFCDFVERARTLSLAERLPSARTHLLDLYRTGAVLPSFERFEGTEPPPSPRPERWVGFGEHDMYAEIFDPYVDDPPVMGSLSDDVLGVHGDVVRGLELWERGQRTNAVWEWRFGFDHHWGDHAVDALRALHRACGRAG